MNACLIFGYLVCLVLCVLSHKEFRLLQWKLSSNNNVSDREASEFMFCWRAGTWLVSIILTFVALAKTSGLGWLVMVPVTLVWLGGTIWMFFIDTGEK